MSKLEVVKFEPMTVYGIESENGIASAPETHQRLDDILGEDKDLFDPTYGIDWPYANSYFVGTQPTEVPLNLDQLTSAFIPGGPYSKKVIPGWNGLSETDVAGVSKAIVDAHADFSDEAAEEGVEDDDSRPYVEIYHRLGDLIVLFPVRIEE